MTFMVASEVNFDREFEFNDLNRTWSGILQIWEIHVTSQPGQAERLHDFLKSGGYQTMYDLNNLCCYAFLASKCIYHPLTSCLRPK